MVNIMNTKTKLSRNRMSRRKVLGGMGIATAGMALAPNIAQAISISIGGGGGGGGGGLPLNHYKI